MNLYTVVAFRWDCNETETNILVGVFSTRKEAHEHALAYECFRGGKYTCHLFSGDKLPVQTNSHSLGKDKLATVLSYYRESLIDTQK